MANDTLVSEKGAHRNMLTCQSENLYLFVFALYSEKKSGSWEKWILGIPDTRREYSLAKTPVHKGTIGTKPYSKNVFFFSCPYTMTIFSSEHKWADGYLGNSFTMQMISILSADPGQIGVRSV